MTIGCELYVVTDEQLSRGLSHAEIALQAVRGGADVVQLRDKNASGRYIYDAAVQMREVTRNSGTVFIVNDRLDIALSVGADGVHLGQYDMPLLAARRIAPNDLIIGVSVGTVPEAVQAEHDGADYIAFGPVFPTASKNDAGPGLGLKVLSEIGLAVTIPLVAIGGIGPQNVREVVSNGADGVAVISAVVGQEDIARATRELREMVLEAKVR
jgi:thiamine-phosphate pyrophosphorylase